jgi:hypothetical protein
LKRRRIVSGLLVTLGLILSMFGTTLPAYAADVALTKGVTPPAPNVYRLGDTIHYVMSITNLSDVMGTNEDIVVEAVWDVLPDGSTVYPTGPALPYTLTPGQNQSYTYDWVATINGTVLNTFYGSGYQISTGGNDYFNLSVAKSSLVIDPAIHIEKSTNGEDADSPTGPYIAVGGPVTWEYVITNPGDSSLSNIIVTDSEAGVTPAYVSGDDGDNILQTTETWIYQATGTAVAGQYANTGNATGTPLLGPDVSDDDPSHYFGSDACIHIEKSTNGQDADLPTGPVIPVGGAVLWEYVVTNCGSVNLTSIVVTDSEAGVTPVYVGGDDGSDGILEPYSLTGETWIYQASGTAVAGQYANTGNATGTPPVGSPISDTDPSHYFGSDVCIHIEKSTNGQDADLPTGPAIPVGGAVLWEYVITNCGSVNLTNIVVTDSEAGVIPTYVSGDDGSDGILEPYSLTGETWIYQASGTAVAGQYANTGNVTGTPPVGSNVSDDDPSHYLGLGPDIHIEKHTNGADADAPTGPHIIIGDSVTWTYIITNIGGVNLTSIVVTDSEPGVIPAYVSGDDGSDGILEPYSLTGETWIYQASGTAMAGQYANIGTVTGTPLVGPAVSDDDPSHYFGRDVTVGWETYPVNKERVLLPWIALLAAIMVGASLLLILRHRRAQS